jgi:hypothetical protein
MCRSHGIARRVGRAGRAGRIGDRDGRGGADAGDDHHQLTESIAIKQRWNGGRLVQGRQEGLGCPTRRDGGVAAVGEADDEVGVHAAADADDLDLLAIEGMEGMGDRHELGRRRGPRWSVLWGSPP